MLSPSLVEQIGKAVESGTDALFARQRPDGVFAPAGDRFSPGNTAVALIALSLVDGAAGTDDVIARGADRLIESRRPDGGWAMAGVPTELLTTAVVTAALQITAPGRAESAIRQGLAAVARLGGPEALPEPTMTGLVGQFEALAGRRDPETLPRLPLALVLFRGLSRRLLSLRLPIFASMALAQAALRHQGPVRKWLNRRARPVALRIVREAYAREGSTGGFSTDPWLTSLISIGVTRSGLAPDISRATARRLRSMARPDGSWDLMPLDITWSDFAAAALLEAGHGDDPRLTATRDMFHARQQDTPFAALACPAGFWGFSSEHSWPMALETAEASSVLLRLPGGADDDHARRGIAWLTAMQDKAGSWSLAVRDSKPGGFGPCPYMTAKAVCALLTSGVPADDRRIVKALGWLEGAQASDGSVEALWYRGRTPGTAVALEAFCRAGEGMSAPARRARDWLLRAQSEDGSWGTGEEGAGPEGTAEETGWALYALLAAGADPRQERVASAARWLAEAQRADGCWTGAAVNEYVRECSRYADDGIASGLALRALARLRAAVAAEPPQDGVAVLAESEPLRTETPTPDPSQEGAA